MSLPNKIVVFRIALSVIILFLGMIFCQNNYHYNIIIRYIIFIIAIILMISDYLDGYIARKYDMISNFGKIMDPIADKVFLISMLSIFASSGDIISNTLIIKIWVISIIIIRDLIISGLRMNIIISNKNSIQANIFGKIKMIIQMFAVLLGLMIWIGLLNIKHNYIKIIWDIAVLMLILSTIISGILYMIKFKNIKT